MRFHGGFLPVNLEEVIDVLILLIAENVNAQAVWLILSGTMGDRLQETHALLCLDPDLHPHCQPVCLLSRYCRLAFFWAAVPPAP